MRFGVPGEEPVFLARKESREEWWRPDAGPRSTPRGETTKQHNPSAAGAPAAPPSTGFPDPPPSIRYREMPARKIAVGLVPESAALSGPQAPFQFPNRE